MGRGSISNFRLKMGIPWVHFFYPISYFVSPPRRVCFLISCFLQGFECFVLSLGFVVVVVAFGIANMKIDLSIHPISATALRNQIRGSLVCTRRQMPYALVRVGMGAKPENGRFLFCTLSPAFVSSGWSCPALSFLLRCLLSCRPHLL